MIVSPEWRRLVAVAAFACWLVPGSAPAQFEEGLDTGIFYSVLPPGNSGHMSAAEALEFLDSGVVPVNIDDQRPLYDNLVYADPGLTDDDLDQYFKRAIIGQPAFFTVPPKPPRDGVTILRDEFGVPFISARTRRAIYYGIGWASAAERLFSMDLARRAGRGRLSEFIGGDAFALDQDRSLYSFAGYDEADLEAQNDILIKEFGQRGKRALREVQNYVDGVNDFIIYANQAPLARAPAEYTGLNLPIEPFRPTDITAIAVQLEFLFGAGGGGEHRNAELLQRLEMTLGGTDGPRLWEDLRHRLDPEHSNTTKQVFPFTDPGPVDPAAVAMPDLGSVQGIDIIEVTAPPAGGGKSIIDASFLKRRELPSASNFLAINADRAAGGHPIAVMGPQAGYLVPELLMEINVEGNQIKTRGVAVSGTPYVVLGRGQNYAWSATAGGSDMTDVRVELLCNPGGGPAAPDSKHYVFNGECIPMFERVDSWCAGDPDDPFNSCQGQPDNVTATVLRSVHGIVFARATVDGVPVALSKQRASFFREGQNAAAFRKINARTRNPRAFQRSINLAPGSFNWIYVNERNLSFFHSGLYPVRAPGVDLDFPSWGTGEWEWTGEFMHRREHPQDLDPEIGYLTSWNNKPAAGWRSADSNYSFGAIHRVDMLDDLLEARLAEGTPIEIAEMVEIMEDAGLTDLRGTRIVPLALELVGSEAGLDPILALLQDWVDAGAQRRDRDQDGDYDHASAVAFMDAWWRPLIDETVGPQLDPFNGSIPLGFHNAPGSVGSAFQSGYYGLVNRVLRMALGKPDVTPFQVLQCADGSQGGCRAAVVASLNTALGDLTTQFGSADPADWDAQEESEQIDFMPFGLADVDNMHWVNRPTFQQVVQVQSRREEIQF